MSDPGTVNRHTVYPLADGSAEKRRNYRAVWDGRPRRCARSGEWYLSGNPVEAYHAPNGSSIEFHIATLVEGTTEWRPV